MQGFERAVEETKITIDVDPQLKKKRRRTSRAVFKEKNSRAKKKKEDRNQAVERDTSKAKKRSRGPRGGPEFNVESKKDNSREKDFAKKRQPSTPKVKTNLARR